MQSATIESIVFANGLVVGNVSKEASNRIGLILFGEPKPNVIKEPVKHAARKRRGWRAPRWTEVEEDKVWAMYQEGRARGQKVRIILSQIAKEINRSSGAINNKITELRRAHKAPVPGTSVTSNVPAFTTGNLGGPNGSGQY